MQETADLLFYYLKDILYDPEHAALDTEKLPSEFQKLGQGMQFLADCVRESRQFGRAMARGDLSQKPPGAENVLAAPLKELQNSLKHLAWQTKEVAKGDYSQTVDFMGEFSTAFNTMTRQLKDRQENLILEKQVIEGKNLELEHNLELVMTLTKFTHNMIVVYSVEDRTLLFSNEAAQWFCKTRPDTYQQIQDIICEKSPEEFEAVPMWELEVGDMEGGAGSEYFGVESHYFLWGDQKATLHILMDDTERKKKENLMFKLAYIDPLTGLNNRRYAMDRMKRLMEGKTPFVMSFIDIDYLKYCNDTFGHKAGDQYLLETANALKSLSTDVCRIGGDEFIMVDTGITAEKQDERLEELRKMLKKDNGIKPYPESFSYASCDVPAGTEVSLEEYIKYTDTKMYQYKVQHKLPLKEAVYNDDRI